VKFDCDVRCIGSELIVHYSLISLYSVNSLNISVNFLMYIRRDNIKESITKHEDCYKGYWLCAHTHSK